ncbi:MAG: SPASM domain-containing protein [Proteobacteria bacterium]|nr:SPASM domain-containing protein [Pseudomonadota bacterium]
MCGWKAWTRNSGFMDFGLFKKVISEMLLNGYTHVNFTGAQGEPMLNPSFESYMGYAMDAGLSTFISTNCTTLNRKNIAKLCALTFRGKLSMIGSFAGHDKKSYESMYVGGNFETVTRNLWALRSELAKLGKAELLSIRGVVLDAEQAENSIAFLKTLGFEPDRIDMVVPDNFAGHSTLGDVDPFSNLRTCQQSLGIRPLRLCGWLLDTNMIYDNGEVTACGCRDAVGALRIGNITTQSLAEIRNGNVYLGYLAKFLSRDLSGMPLCAGCDIPYGDPIKYPDFVRQADHAIEDGDNELAIRLLRQLPDIENDVPALDRLVRAHVNLGSLKEALVAVRRMQEIAPSDYNIQLSEADILIRMGEFAPAHKIYSWVLTQYSASVARPVSDIIASRDWIERNMV